MQLTRLAAAVVALLLLSTTTAAADGWLSMRGAYYKERSTRVVQPMLDAAFEPSEDTTVVAHVLVDSITSASGASGAQGVAFTELRYEAGVGYTRAFRNMRAGVSGKYSTESDYDAGFITLHGEIDLNDKNTTIGVTEGRGLDKITNGVAADRGGLGFPRIEHTLSTGLTSVSVTQLLSPRLVGAVTYDLIDAHGYQANVYRLVPGGVAAVPERVPTLRLRNALHAGLRAFLPWTNTTVVVSYRFYFDDWGILAHTPEARVTQQVLRGLDVRLRYRFHTQTAADFYQDTYELAEIEDQSRYVTADDKLDEFQTQQLGAQLLVALGLFGVEGTWADAHVDVQVDRILQTNRFGDAWEGQLAFVVPVAW